eukprot:1433251-Pyramimonas_sp.AAC.1
MSSFSCAEGQRPSGSGWGSREDGGNAVCLQASALERVVPIPSGPRGRTRHGGRARRHQLKR